MEQLKQILGGLSLDTIRATEHSEEDVVNAWLEVAGGYERKRFEVQTEATGNGCKFQLIRRAKRYGNN